MQAGLYPGRDSQEPYHANRRCNTRGVTFYALILLTVLMGFSMVACGDGEIGESHDLAGEPVDYSSEAEGEDTGVYSRLMTEAEVATLSCGEYGFGMGLEESDLPMVQCIVDKSRGEEGRADLLSGMMQDAIRSSNQAVVRLLLEAGIDADGESPFGEPFLLSALNQLTFTASDSGQSPEGEAAVAIGDILVDEGARVPEPPGEYVNAWFIAVETSPDAMRIMIRAGMDANVRRPLEERFNVETALVHAVKRACSSVVSDVSDPDRPELEIVRLLVEAGADVNTMSIGQILDENFKVIGLFESETVLADAVGGQTGCPQVVNILREAGACLDLEGRRVEWGSELDFDGILQFLSAPVAFPPREGVECAAPPPDSLERAIRREDVDMVRLLTEAGADVNAVDSFGETVLHEAIRRENVEVARLLIEAGADLNAVDSFGETVLHQATLNEDVGMVRLLIEAGADVNAGDYSGETVLYEAIQNEDVDMVRLLIEAGADVNAMVRPRTTLLQWAVSTVRNPTIIELLEKAGAK